MQMFADDELGNLQWLTTQSGSHVIRPPTPPSSPSLGLSGNSAVASSADFGHIATITIAGLPVSNSPVDLSADGIDYQTNPAKPRYSYAQLITMAMEAHGGEKVLLTDIYDWLKDTFAYFRLQDGSWQNSIRHNLSLNKQFLKVARDSKDKGKGSYWMLDVNRKDPYCMRRRNFTPEPRQPRPRPNVRHPCVNPAVKKFLKELEIGATPAVRNNLSGKSAASGKHGKVNGHHRAKCTNGTKRSMVAQNVRSKTKRLANSSLDDDVADSFNVWLALSDDSSSPTSATGKCKSSSSLSDDVSRMDDDDIFSSLEVLDFSNMPSMATKKIPDALGVQHCVTPQLSPSVVTVSPDECSPTGGIVSHQKPDGAAPIDSCARIFDESTNGANSTAYTSISDHFFDLPDRQSVVCAPQHSQRCGSVGQTTDRKVQVDYNWYDFDCTQSFSAVEGCFSAAKDETVSVGNHGCMNSRDGVPIPTPIGSRDLTWMHGDANINNHSNLVATCGSSLTGASGNSVLIGENSHDATDLASSLSTPKPSYEIMNHVFEEAKDFPLTNPPVSKMARKARSDSDLPVGSISGDFDFGPLVAAPVTTAGQSSNFPAQKADSQGVSTSTSVPSISVGSSVVSEPWVFEPSPPQGLTFLTVEDLNDCFRDDGLGMCSIFGTVPSDGPSPFGTYDSLPKNAQGFSSDPFWFMDVDPITVSQ